MATRKPVGQYMATRAMHQSAEKLAEEIVKYCSDTYSHEGGQAEAELMVSCLLDDYRERLGFSVDGVRLSELEEMAKKKLKVLRTKETKRLNKQKNAT